ncbi:uncharacterized protein BDW43DRAFT_233545 [Aspergillus alliaceus]|uniref:uncharacterized protein n=1 Tax=Petromyces alliaceus TaxID=209559 RepID=UPI0012A4724F|nr:uncharacterized protein BDW43DRAFT_233545 [Aspergillus alliaceus]KAB8227962.1 hypothetical protein BDW43DRAFT_233545 [Aspergillus alliaceus]
MPRAVAPGTSFTARPVLASGVSLHLRLSSPAWRSSGPLGSIDTRSFTSPTKLNNERIEIDISERPPSTSPRFEVYSRWPSV